MNEEKNETFRTQCVLHHSCLSWLAFCSLLLLLNIFPLPTLKLVHPLIEAPNTYVDHIINHIHTVDESEIYRLKLEHHQRLQV